MSFKRRVLSALDKEELFAIADELGLDVARRTSKDDLLDTIARSKRATMAAIVRDALSRDTLKAICAACGLDEAGKEKSVLVARILAAAEGSPRPQAGDDAQTKKAPKKGTKRRRAGIPESEAVVSGTLKAALRQFALSAAGGYRGRDASVSFVTHLLESFGWADGRPEGAEIPRTFAIADGGRRVEREVALWWPARRAMLDVVAHDAVLDFAWRDLVRLCLQVDPIPQYVVLTNQRDLQLYDLARDRESPRLSIPLDDLSKYSEAFPFFTTDWVPGATPRIVNVEKVSTEVADLVAKLYRSVLAQHPGRERDVIRFTLQCITAMFAEDIGLLPRNYFTSLLYDGARYGDAEHRLRELFVQMNTRDLPAPRVVPFFNGGLFTDAVTLPLGSAQLVALTKAAEANWTYVDPHIFGSVFQGIMDDAERHASGAHYTAHDDIMRVVGPTIVEPWRRRIQAATSLKELQEARADLLKFRVLDPACGSGNFLYVAFRELYRLDTELLSRMLEFPSMGGKLSWASGIQTTSFFGIDINPFAVELAKVTLNIAKKIAFEERRAQAFTLAGQVEMEIDPSLPLDNLDQNIVCADALLMEWPQVDAIVGNPPFLGEKWLRTTLGPGRVEELKERYPGVGGDLCVYWFRRAHDRLPSGGRAGLVATSNIRAGGNRAAALDYIIGNGGTITNAVSERDWPGDAAVHVSMVNWCKARLEGPHELVIGDQVFKLNEIPSHLQLHGDASAAARLAANTEGTCQGITFGTKAFYVDSATASTLRQDPAAAPFVQAVANGDDVLRGSFESTPDYALHLGGCLTDQEARATGPAYRYLLTHVRPRVEEKARKATTNHYAAWLRTWWRPFWHRHDFLNRVTELGLPRVIACSRVASRPIFFFLTAAGIVPMERLQLFSFADDYTFGVLQSSHHWEWIRAKGGRQEERLVYTTEVWATFPWPQAPDENAVVAVGVAARNLRNVRRQLMTENEWSLRTLYQAAEVEGPHPLKDAQAALDRAVGEAYGMPPHQAAMDYLLELNQLVAEDEKRGDAVQGPGLPEGLDSNDPRWLSSDCIAPPLPTD